MRKLIDPKNLIMHLNDWMFAEGCEEGWNYDKNKVVPDYERQQAIYNTIQQCIDAVFDQPTVEAEPIRHGHWVDDGQRFGNDNECAICECDQCGETIWVYLKDHRRWNYCPQCGSKMSEEVYIKLKRKDEVTE